MKYTLLNYVNKNVKIYNMLRKKIYSKKKYNLSLNHKKNTLILLKYIIPAQ